MENASRTIDGTSNELEMHNETNLGNGPARPWLVGARRRQCLGRVEQRISNLLRLLQTRPLQFLRSAGGSMLSCSPGVLRSAKLLSALHRLPSADLSGTGDDLSPLLLSGAGDNLQIYQLLRSLYRLLSKGCYTLYFLCPTLAVQCGD